MIALLWWLALQGIASHAHSEVLVQTHGYMSIAPYLHGTVASQGITPTYRSDYMAFVDILEWRGFRFNYLLGNSTILGTSSTERIRLDRIRYMLSPGFRYEFGNWQIRGRYQHECLHTIDRPEIEYPGFTRGSIWWNSYQIGIGSKGSSHIHLRKKYLEPGNRFINAWDGQVNVGKYVPPAGTANTGRSHNFHSELFSNLRYHIGMFNDWAAFVNLGQHLWRKTDDTYEQRWTLTVNLFRRGKDKFAGIYYTYVIRDTFSPDNENKTGAIGLKILL